MRLPLERGHFRAGPGLRRSHGSALAVGRPCPGCALRALDFPYRMAGAGLLGASACRRPGRKCNIATAPLLRSRWARCDRSLRCIGTGSRALPFPLPLGTSVSTPALGGSSSARRRTVAQWPERLPPRCQRHGALLLGMAHSASRGNTAAVRGFDPTAAGAGRRVLRHARRAETGRRRC